MKREREIGLDWIGLGYLYIITFTMNVIKYKNEKFDPKTDRERVRVCFIYSFLIHLIISPNLSLNY
jgi:hypothetical protein